MNKTLLLDARQLHEGRVLYSPMFQDLNFRLEINTSGNRTEAQAVQVLNAGPNSVASLLSDLIHGSQIGATANSTAERPQSSQ